MKTFVILTCFSNEDCGKKYDFPKYHTNSDFYKILLYILHLRIDLKHVNVLTDIIPTDQSIRSLYASLSHFIPNLSKNVEDLQNYSHNTELLLRIAKSLKEDQISAFCAIFTNIHIIDSRKKYLYHIEKVTEKMLPKDRLIWYYSGHGEMENKVGILVPNRRKGICSILETSKLRKYLYTIPSSCEVFCIFDCCHAQIVVPVPTEGRGPRFTSIASSQQRQLSGFYNSSPYGSLFSHFFLDHLIKTKSPTFKSISSVSKDINYQRSKDNKPKQTICFSTNEPGDKIPSWFLFEN